MGLGTVEHWHPVTHDYGVIRARLRDVVREYVDWQTSFGVRHAQREIATDLASAFQALTPLSMGKRRRLFVATSSEWTACFQNGIQGSDPFPAMSFLAQQMGVLAMRICSTPEDAKWLATAWEVYAPEGQGGQSPLGYRRSIFAMNDGGRWVFEQSGDPYPFEDLRAYERHKKRDRFTRDLLEQYLRHFGIRPFADDFFLVNEDSAAILLKRPPMPNEPPDFTLDEVVADAPWKGA